MLFQKTPVFINLEKLDCILVFSQLKSYLMNDFLVLWSYRLLVSIYYVLIYKTNIVLTAIKLECQTL